jgi:hypothetical protein
MGLFSKKKNEDNIQIDTSKLKINENAAFGAVLPSSGFGEGSFDFGNDLSFGNNNAKTGLDGLFNDNTCETDKIQDEHKKKCEELRKIRKSMAKTLGAPELIRDEPCNYEGHCSGTCPACYMEERALMDRIYKLHENGIINMVYSDDIKNMQRKIEEHDDNDFFGDIG